MASVHIAILHDDDAVAQSHGLGLVVGNVHEGGVDTAAQLDDLRAHLVTELGVQVGQRLVHQQNLGLTDDRTADGDTLTLAAGQGLGLTVEVLGDAQDLSGLVDLPVDLFLGNLLQLQGESDVVPDRHVGVQSVALEYHGDIAVLGGYVVAALVADEQVAAGDVFQSGHHTQGGGLSAAGGTNQDDELLVLDLDVHVVNGGHLVVVDLLQTLDCHTCHSCRL